MTESVQVEVETSPMVERYAQAIGVDVGTAMRYFLTSAVPATCELHSSFVPVLTIPGHKVGYNDVTPVTFGPSRARVMLIVSHPNDYEAQQQRYFTGPAGNELRSACQQAGIQDVQDWYATGMVKYSYPAGKKNALAAWRRDCLPILLREIKEVDPDFIVMCGSNVTRGLMKSSLADVRGRVFEFEGYRCWAIGSPHGILSRPEGRQAVYDDVAEFGSLVRGERAEWLLDWEEIVDVGHLRRFVATYMQRTVFAFDCEWGGKNYKDGQLRTLQICPEPGKVGVLHFRTAGWPGEVLLPEEEAVEPLRQLLCRDGVRMVGHHIRADLPWLLDMGVDILEQCRNGMDTILASHHLFPLEPQELESVAGKLLGQHRYDVEVAAWLDEHKEHVRRWGFAHVPDDILLPYAAWDADKTYRIAVILMRMLRDPRHASLLRSYTLTHRAMEGILEMEMSGLPVDMLRFVEMEDEFTRKHEDMINDLREELQWPDFNPGSPMQRTDWIFGSRYHHKLDDDGNPRRVRPENVQCLGCTPIKATGSGKDWNRVIEDNEEHMQSPATDDETISILASQHPVLTKLRDERYIAKHRSNNMPPPVRSRVERGTTYYKSGVRSWIDSDTRIRTMLFQLAETRRWRSSHPNLQNWPTKREADFRRIMEDPEFHVFKSIVVGDPDMPIIIESDYQGAEVLGLGYLSGDPDLIHICLAPDRDIHSEMAINAFGLGYDSDCGVSTKKWINGQPCPFDAVVDRVDALPNERGGLIWFVGHGEPIRLWPGLRVVVEAGQQVHEGQRLTESLKHLRVSAKSIIFGIPYQRGDLAAAREIWKAGVNIEIHDVKKLKEAYHQSFKKVGPFLEECKQSVYTPGYLESVWGMRRPFSYSQDPSVMKAQEREACNWKVQNLVAQAIDKAVGNFAEYKRERNFDGFRLKLAIHDSVIACTTPENVPRMIDEVFPQCMSTNCVVPRLNFSFGIDSDLFLRWGEKPDPAEFIEMGVPEDYVH